VFSVQFLVFSLVLIALIFTTGNTSFLELVSIHYKRTILRVSIPFLYDSYTTAIR